MSDVDCPYCHKGVDICRDDGHGCSEDERYEQECPHCMKNFVFLTSIVFHHEAYAADCLNGAPHRVEPSCTSPVAFTKMACTDCDYRREPTAEEMAEIVKERGKLSIGNGRTYRTVICGGR